MINNIRYSLVKKTVCSVILENSINSYPVNLDKIFNNHKDDIRITSYSTHMIRYNLTEDEVLSHFGSEEGCTIYNKKLNRYLIFYNDLNNVYKKKERIKWTITHELGHIFLGHLMEINGVKIFRNSISNQEYKYLEAEANRFAALLLANPIILFRYGNINTARDIESLCGISTEASKYRFSDYEKWLKHKFISSTEEKIINSFFNNTSLCVTCGYKYNNLNFCPICGDNNLIRGDENMIYNKIEINNNGKAAVCPICQNEFTDIPGEFCQVCGTHITNRCTNRSCGESLSGDARFCNFCGSESSFFQNQLLDDWQNHNTNTNTNTKTNSFENSNTYSHFSDDVPF